MSTQQVLNNQELLCYVILKPNHTHLAFAARFCSDASAAHFISCSKALSEVIHGSLSNFMHCGLLIKGLHITFYCIV